MKTLKRALTGTTLAVALFSPILQPAMTLADDDGPRHRDRDPIRHVLLLSIDGLHAVDLKNCIASHLCPNLARLSEHGSTYANAATTKPSDSFPGLLAQLTGGTPKSTGLYYDDSYDRTLFAPAGNPPAPCASGPGAELQIFENLGFNQHSIDGGVPAGLTGLNSAVSIDPNHLPGQLTHGVCAPVWPHNLVRTNTIFAVIHRHHLRTAWSDKHAAYDIINGNDPDSEPSNAPGTNVDDFFAPEINSELSAANVNLIASLGLHSTAPNPTTTCPGPNCGDFTSSIDGVEYYDGIKVQAILNEINGFDHTGTRDLGTPAIFGMNFQSVSVGQKLKIGGYQDPAATPSPNLADAIAFVDRSIGQMVGSLRNHGLSEKTLVIVSAKHGQSPIDRTKRKALDDGAVIAAPIGPNFAFDIGDDGVLIWLKDNKGGKTEAAVDALQAFVAGGGDNGIAKYLFGPALAAMFKDPAHDARAPDIIGITRVGVIYTGGTKIAEHGGFNPDDTHVALLVSHPDFPERMIDEPVATTQIAPTILKALGLDPDELEAVRLEHTKVLPGFDAD
jgi:predicted AlkP superfamily pyrophosphatase or phosphodiesterase